MSQSKDSVAANVEFFLKNFKSYQNDVNTLDSYRTMHKTITDKLSGVDTLIDVGNGGVFSYDTSVVNSITAVDLFLDQLPETIKAEYIPRNVKIFEGDALALPAGVGHFDTGIMVMLLHHLTGTTIKNCEQNLDRALIELWGTIDIGGRLIIVESTIPHWFYFIQKLLFPVISTILPKISKHPQTLIFTRKRIADTLHNLEGHLSISEIPQGKYILIFGHKFPTLLSPLRWHLFELKKIDRHQRQ